MSDNMIPKLCDDCYAKYHIGTDAPQIGGGHSRGFCDTCGTHGMVRNCYRFDRDSVVAALKALREKLRDRESEKFYSTIIKLQKERFIPGVE